MIDTKTAATVLADLQKVVAATSEAYRESTLNDEEMLSLFELSPEELAEADLPSKSRKTASLGGKIRELNTVTENFKRSVSRKSTVIEDQLDAQKVVLERRQQLVKAGHKDAAMLGTMEAHVELIAIFSKYV